jgi:hypothetical protein
VTFFILCSYLSWGSIKENKESSDSTSPRWRAGANSVPVSDASKNIVSTAFLPFYAQTEESSEELSAAGAENTQSFSAVVFHELGERQLHL